MKRQLAGTASAGEGRPGAEPRTDPTAAERNRLLHRMMVLRYMGLMRHSPGWAGTEAVVAGIAAMLSPCDTVSVVGNLTGSAAASPAATAVTVRLAHFAGNGRPDRIFALFSHRDRVRIRRTVVVDGWDVEAVTTAAAAAVQVVRSRDSARLLVMPVSTGHGDDDPITVLADRMRQAHQLDDNALHATDLDARRVAGRLMRGYASGGPGIDKAFSVMVATTGALAPPFSPRLIGRRRLERAERICA